MWEPDTLRAGPAGPGRSEDTMSGKNGKGAARAVPRAYGRLTRHERDTIQRMLERRASCREIARELGRSPSTVSAEVSSHRFVTAPKPRRGERVGAGTDLSSACVSANLKLTTFANASRRMR
jgi:DNA-binding CsgD family transcriptional regulator